MSFSRMFHTLSVFFLWVDVLSVDLDDEMGSCSSLFSSTCRNGGADLGLPCLNPSNSRMHAQGGTQLDTFGDKGKNIFIR